ncbi:acyltransferase [Eggerthella timonensis]|uniref:acyltransferase n=1 Tax=Eggerthella timonensis TaxID=1871008 RepID=UPI001FEB08B5|nr:acyltransferase [Eggerthella timonensis]
MVDDGALVGRGSRVWANAHIVAGAVVGENCNIGQNVYVDAGAIVGNRCKLQNNVNVYKGVVLEDCVFCGPSMTFTNVSLPRCEFPRDPEGKYYLQTRVCYGASLGAHSVVVCGHRVGRFAFVGSGAVVCKDVVDHAIVVGNPARQIGWACRCGEKLMDDLSCSECGRQYVHHANSITCDEEERQHGIH